MAWSDPLLSVFEDGDVLTQGNINTYILDNLLALPHKLDYNVTDLDVTNTTAETTFYTVTVPANTMGTTGLVAMKIIGDIKGTTAGNHTITFRLKFGGVTHMTYTADMVNVTSYIGMNLIFGVANKNATNSQLVWAERALAGAALAVAHTNAFVPVTAAIDTTVDQALLLTVQWAAPAVATDSVRRRVARTEIGRN